MRRADAKHVSALHFGKKLMVVAPRSTGGSMRVRLAIRARAEAALKRLSPAFNALRFCRNGIPV
jgi:hypothetical protein